VIDRTREHARELGFPNALFKGGHLGLRLGDDPLVVLARAQVEKNAGIVDIARQFLDAREALFEGRSFARDCLCLLLVVPEPGGESLLFETIDLRLQLRKVKDAPLAP
jgi:hypothetical protein